MLRRIIGRQQEHRQHEDDEPDAGQRTGDAVALMRDGIETEQRHESEQRASGLGIGGEKAEHQDETENAADIAGGPSGARQSPDPVRRHQRRHHRIVEDGGEFDADGRDRIGQQQRRNHADVAGPSNPHEAGAEHQESAECGDPRLAAAARVGNRAQYRRHQCDRQSRSRGRETPQRLSARGIRRHMRSEIGCEHKGGDQREIGLRRPIEENPADNGRSRRIFLPQINNACVRSDCYRHARNIPANHKEGFAYSIGTHIASMATGALRTLQRLLAAEF